jgi:ankyrin repeat protein
MINGNQEQAKSAAAYVKPSAPAEADRLLFIAARGGIPSEISNCLAAGGDPKMANGNGWTPLMAAVALDPSPRASICVKILIPGSDLAASNSIRRTALMIAADKKNAEAVRLLVAEGAACAPNARNVSGETALMLAAKNGATHCVELLAPLSDPEAKNDLGYFALLLAAANGHSSCVEALLAIAPSTALLANDEGETPLMRAIACRDQAGVRALLPLSDLDARNSEGNGVVEAAQKRGSPVMSEMVAAEIARRERLALFAAVEAGASGPGAEKRRPLAL